MAGHHYYQHIGVLRFNCFERFQTIYARQPNIEQYQLRHFLLNNFNRLLTAARHQYLMTFVA